MKTNTLLILLIIFSSLITQAQNQANIWYFGDFAGLDFNSGEPVNTHEIPHGGSNANAVMCDTGDIVISEVYFTDTHCGQNTGTINITAVSGAGIGLLFSIDNGNNWQTDSVFTDLPAGNYFVKVGDEGDCESVFENNPVIIENIEGPEINIGNDTAIGLFGSITITAPEGFDNYYWSTGQEGKNINITGEELGLGLFRIWCDAIIGNCVVSDTIELTVYDNTGITENSAPDINVFPNPFTEKVSIQFELFEAGNAEITFYNHLGYQVGFIKQTLISGKQRLEWNPVQLPYGLYYYKLKLGVNTISGKLIHTK